VFPADGVFPAGHPGRKHPKEDRQARQAGRARHTVGVLDRISSIKLRSPLSRAVVPVLGGLAFFVVLALVTWGIAALISGSGNATERLAPSTFTVGSTRRVAGIVAEDGPILFPGLNTTTGERTIVLSHDGDDPDSGWAIRFAYPADADPSCTIQQVETTATFVDCDGRTIEVADLARPPAGVNPIVDNGTLILDLRGAR
jgi:hypothetical protein